MIKINNIVGNPPYNGPGPGRPPIYHTITEILNKRISPIDEFKWIVQYNWITQENDVGRVMRKQLIDLGVYKIEDNRFAGFTEASVRTCTIHCLRGYKGDIELVDRVRQKSRLISPEIFINQAQVPAYTQAEINLLKKLQAASQDILGIPKVWETEDSGKIVRNKGKYKSFAVAVTYFADFKNGGVGKMQSIDPNLPFPSSYRVFKDYNNLANLQEAETYRERLESFWYSKLVKFILGRTLTSRTIDNPQIKWVPFVSMDRIWTDQDLALHFNLTQDEIDLINSNIIEYDLASATNNILTDRIKKSVLTESTNKAIFRTEDRKDLNGEVFTPSDLVFHMLTELSDRAWNPEETFLDPTCGNGQILAAIATVKKELSHTNFLETIYGFDLMEDNVAECRQRLLDIAGDTEENRQIVNKNIIVGNVMELETYINFSDIPNIQLQLNGTNMLVDINQPSFVIDLSKLTNPEEIYYFFKNNKIKKYVYGIKAHNLHVKYGRSGHHGTRMIPGERVRGQCAQMSGWTINLDDLKNGSEFKSVMDTLGVTNKDLFQVEIWDLTNHKQDTFDPDYNIIKAESDLLQQFKKLNGRPPIGNVKVEKQPSAVNKEHFASLFEESA